MEKDWVLIFSTDQSYKSALMKGLLQDHDIECLEINKKDSFYLIGEFELYVKRNKVLKAKRIINGQQL